jgi:uncharacterized LabA/DUF88 family protein
MEAERTAGFRSQEKVAMFIDGESLRLTARTLGFDIDYALLLSAFRNTGALLRAFYYATIIENPEQFSSLRPLLDWLDYNGYSVVAKAGREVVDAGGMRKTKSSIAIELAVDAMEFAPLVGHMILFSGDGDLRPLVKAVQRRGVRVTVVSSIVTQPAMVADDLRRQADAFMDLHDLRSAIARRERADIQVQRGNRRDGIESLARRRSVVYRPTNGDMEVQTPEE